MKKNIFKTTLITAIILVTGFVMWNTRIETSNPETQLNYHWVDGKEVYDIESLNELLK